MRDYIYLLAPAIAWLVSQGIKFVLSLRKDGVSWSDMIQSGGLPSSHSAFMVAITTVVGLDQGIKSVAFGILFSVTAIILYDSVGVRRTTGEQIVAIQELAEHDNKRLKTVIHVARGHSYPEVSAGCFVGLIVGLVLNALIK